jgi:hypothetical protein
MSINRVKTQSVIYYYGIATKEKLIRNNYLASVGRLNQSPLRRS